MRSSYFTPPTGSGSGGSAGPQGPAGADGADGADGAPGLVWLGVWSAATTYAIGDAVAWDGSSFICTTAHTNHEPPNDTYWDVLAAAGIDGGEATVQYSVNDIEDPYYGFTTDTAEWLVKKVETDGVSYATVLNNGSVTTYADAWTARAALTYGRYDQAF